MDMVKRIMVLALGGAALCAHTPAKAAAAKATYFACKDQLTFKKGTEYPAGTDAKEARGKMESYFKAKIAVGDCVQLARGEELSVDQRAGNLWCVRPSGGLDCYWTTDKIVDLDPSSSSSSSSTQPRGSRRH